MPWNNMEPDREIKRGKCGTTMMEVAEKAGDGYDVYIGINRANVSVRTATEEAMADNLDHNTLEKAIR